MGKRCFIIFVCIAYVVINFIAGILIDADTIFILMMVPGIDMFRLFLLGIYNKKIHSI